MSREFYFPELDVFLEQDVKDHPEQYEKRNGHWCWLAPEDREEPSNIVLDKPE